MSLLKEVGDQLLVGDLVLPEGATVLADAAELVVRLDYPRLVVEEEEEEDEDLLFGEETPEVEVITERKEDEDE